MRASEPMGFDAELWRQFVELRAVAMGVPEADGGDGAGLVELSLVAEEVGRAVAPVPFIEAAVVARLLARCGAPAESWCRDALDGTKLVTLALRPVRPDDRQLVPAGAVADAVVALVDGDLVVVTGSTPLPHVANHGFAPLGRLNLDDAGATVTSIASGEDAVDAFEAAVDEWRLLMAAAQVGMATTALALAVDFATNREAFGVPIATFQAMSHPLAERYIGIVGARRLVWKAAWFADHEPATNRQLIPMAFRYAGPRRDGHRHHRGAHPGRPRVHHRIRHAALLPSRQGVGERARRSASRAPSDRGRDLRPDGELRRKPWTSA